ncbi:2' O-ribose methyltransferase [Sorochytrium milnesiophthora]
MSSARWIQRHVNDHFVRRAREMQYNSRAAFKLLELQTKYKFLGRGAVVVDAGAAPGGWTQVALEHVQGRSVRVDDEYDMFDQQDEDGSDHEAPEGLVIAVDLLPLNPPLPQAVLVQRDLTLSTTQSLIRDIAGSYRDMQPSSQRKAGLVDVVLCDMAPSIRRSVLESSGDED